MGSFIMDFPDCSRSLDRFESLFCLKGWSRGQDLMILSSWRNRGNSSNQPQFCSGPLMLVTAYLCNKNIVDFPKKRLRYSNKIYMGPPLKYDLSNIKIII